MNFDNSNADSDVPKTAKFGIPQLHDVGYRAWECLHIDEGYRERLKRMGKPVVNHHEQNLRALRQLQQKRSKSSQAQNSELLRDKPKCSKQGNPHPRIAAELLSNSCSTDCESAVYSNCSTAPLSTQSSIRRTESKHNGRPVSGSTGHEGGSTAAAGGRAFLAANRFAVRFTPCGIPFSILTSPRIRGGSAARPQSAPPAKATKSPSSGTRPASAAPAHRPGAVPAYLAARKAELADQAMQRALKAEEARRPAGMRAVPEEERVRPPDPRKSHPLTPKLTPPLSSFSLLLSPSLSLSLSLSQFLSQSLSLSVALPDPLSLFYL